MNISPWLALALALPALLLGEFLVRRLKLLARFNIPAPVASGLLISLGMLAVNLAGAELNLAGAELKFITKTPAAWWTWLVTTEPDWQLRPALDVHRPFLVAFFTCIGLNASWSLVKRGSLQVLLFLLLAGVLAVIQNIIGVGLAKALDVSPLLGLVCGSVAMTGGHGTALGFAAELQKAGLEGAAVVGVAAATFGLVAGGLVGGPVGGGLIRRFNLKSTAPLQTHLEAGQAGESGILADLRNLAQSWRVLLVHLLLLLGCVKLGAWVSHLIQMAKITFPVYIGAMLLGVGVRNAVELAGGRWIRTETIDTLASVMLGVFLAIAMMSLNLIELASAAVPMLLILGTQVGVMALYAWFVTYRFMGRDFDAAVMAGGHCGFGLGATPNAVANMKALVERFGPAPRAFLVLPIVGAFLIDFVNAMNITAFLNLLKS